MTGSARLKPLNRKLSGWILPVSPRSFLVRRFLALGGLRAEDANEREGPESFSFEVFSTQSGVQEKTVGESGRGRMHAGEVDQPKKMGVGRKAANYWSHRQPPVSVARAVESCEVNATQSLVFISQMWTRQYRKYRCLFAVKGCWNLTRALSLCTERNMTKWRLNAFVVFFILLWFHSTLVTVYVICINTVTM